MLWVDRSYIPENEEILFISAAVATQGEVFPDCPKRTEEMVFIFNLHTT